MSFEVVRVNAARVCSEADRIVMSRDAALVIGVINFIALGPAILHVERWLPPLKPTGVRQKC